MPGSDPREAVEHSIRRLQTALSCVTRDVLTVSRGAYGDTTRVHALAFAGGRSVLLGAARGTQRVRLDVKIQFRHVEARDGTWTASSAAYKYTVETNDGREVVAYHWHPDAHTPVTSPHVHLGSTVLRQDGVLGHRAHVPTGRVPLQQVIRLAIAELGARPLREDWSDVLDRTENEFRAERAW